MQSLASLTSKVRKIEAQLAPEGRIWAICRYYGCESIDEACDRARRYPAVKTSDMLLVVAEYHCAREGTPHRHDEQPWDACHPPGQVRR